MTSLRLALVLALAGCTSPKDDAPRDGPAATATESAEKHLTGTLRYKALPQTMSVEAYLGVEFTLTDAEGAEHVLAPSDAVPHEALVARDGQRVTVTGEWFVPPPPDEGSAYPTDANGKPLARPGRYRVLALAAAE